MENQIDNKALGELLETIFNSNKEGKLKSLLIVGEIEDEHMPFVMFGNREVFCQNLIYAAIHEEELQKCIFIANGYFNNEQQS